MNRLTAGFCKQVDAALALHARSRDQAYQDDGLDSSMRGLMICLRHLVVAAVKLVSSAGSMTTTTAASLLASLQWLCAHPLQPLQSQLPDGCRLAVTAMDHAKPEVIGRFHDGIAARTQDVVAACDRLPGDAQKLTEILACACLAASACKAAPPAGGSRRKLQRDVELRVRLPCQLLQLCKPHLAEESKDAAAVMELPFRGQKTADPASVAGLAASLADHAAAALACTLLQLLNEKTAKVLDKDPVQLLTDCRALQLLSQYLLWLRAPADLLSCSSISMQSRTATHCALAAACGWYEASQPPAAADAMPAPEAVLQAVLDCATAMVKHAWTHAPAGKQQWTEQDTRCTATGIGILCELSTSERSQQLLTGERQHAIAAAVVVGMANLTIEVPAKGGAAAAALAQLPAACMALAAMLSNAQGYTAHDLRLNFGTRALLVKRWQTVCQKVQLHKGVSKEVKANACRVIDLLNAADTTNMAEPSQGHQVSGCSSIVPLPQ